MMKKILFCLIASFAIAQAFADHGWSNGWQPEKVFIENKGQLPKVGGQDISYMIDNDRTRIYFSGKGLTYSFFKSTPKDNEEEEREREREKDRGFNNNMTAEQWLAHEKEERKANIKFDNIDLIWENSNPNARIVAEEEVPQYYSYTVGKGNAAVNYPNIRAFKKITYKELYPFVDVEYTFHPTEGIKYTLIIHPGADISKIKMKYLDAGRMSLRASGDLHIKTLFGDIVDHAPVTFYGNNHASIINSKFVREGNTVSFELENYNTSETIVIDPWTVTPNINNSKGVWECEKDASGNVYIIAGDSPMKLLKYNAAGALQWTYVTPWDTANDWLGTFATDLNGNSYVTDGSIAALQKINTSGTMVYSVSGGSMDEYWNIAFNCDQTKLIIGGTRLNAFPTVKGYGVIFDVNTANGAVTSTVTVGYTTPGGFGINNPDEVRAITSSYNARYYYMTLDSLGAIDQNFSLCSSNSSLFKRTNGYAFGYKCEDWRPKGNSGIMAIRANKKFLYTQNGTTISKRALSNGAVITTVTIPGGISTASFGFNQPGNMGIDLDSCGNVYVGSGNAVIKYDANLNLITSTSVSFHVYDVAVSTGGDVIACGATGTSSSTSRTGYVQSIPMTACEPALLACCDANVCAAGPFCVTSSNYTLSPATAGGTWSGTGVNSSGVFSPSTAGAGTHNITYTLPCGSDTIQIVVNPCVTLTVCINGSTLNVSGGTPSYTWSTQQTVSSCTACVIGCTFPPGCSTTVTSWSTAATGTSTFTPSSYPVKVVDAAGNSYTITTSGSVPTCTVGCVTPTISFPSVTNVSCHGGNDGAATALASPSATYTYTWQSGSLNGATQTSLTAGIYTVSAATGSCVGSATVSITEPNTLVVTAAQTSSVTCFGGANGTASVTITGGTSTYTVNWSNSTTGTSTSGLGVGTYTANVLDSKGCTASDTVLIKQATPIQVQQLTTDATCGSANGSATVTATGGTPVLTYSWSTGATGNVLSNVAGGTYTAYVTDGNSCVKTATVTINTSGGPTATAAESASVTCSGMSNGSASVSISGGTPTYTVNWSGGGTGTSIGGLAAGTYTAVVTDANSCVTSATVTIDEPTPIAVTFTDNSPSGCTTSTGSVTANASGGTGALTYTWNTGASGQTLGSVGAGTYTVTVTDANSCMQQAPVTIASVNGPTITPTATGSVTCNGGTNGTASVSITGGTPSYTVNWSGGSSGASVTGLSGGIYTITVTDAGGCVTLDTVSIAQPPALTVTVNGTPTGCTNAIGTATANATGGTGSMTYAWSDSQTGATASGLGQGTYTVVATDGNGCKDSSTVMIATTGSISVTASSSPTGCTNSVGTATANATGGAGTVTYTWSDSQTGATATGLGQGTYTVVSTDANGCKDSTTVTIGTTPNPTLTVTGNPTGCTTSIGTATASATGGTGAMTYTWSNTQTGATATGLGAGTYTVTGTDANGCVSTGTVTIGVTPSPTVTIDSTQNITCNGMSDGLAWASSVGGTATYTYSWSNAQTGTSATGLGVGTYSVIVTDAGGCKDTAFLTISQPAPLSETVSAVQDEKCGKANGSATVNTSGGTANYSYQWSGGQAGNTVTNFSAGTYTCVITDANGCKDSTTVTISNVPGPTLTLSAQTNATCFGSANGTATVSVTGGTPTYTYTWSNSATGDTAVGLGAGTYTATVTDANACASAVLVTITQPTILTASPASTSVSCNGGKDGSASVVVAGGTPTYTTTWSNGQSGLNDTALVAGIYTVTVSDINGCPATNTVVVTENPPADTLAITGSICLNDPKVELNAPGIGSAYQWDLNSSPITGANSSTYTGSSATYSDYSVFWTYNGCRYVSTNVLVTTLQDLGSLPQTNVFTPNGDKINDEYIPFATYAIAGGGSAANINSMLSATFEDYELTIYDRWGILLFKTTTVTEAWSGKTLDGKDVTDGTYYWIAKYKAKCSKNTGLQTIKGFVELLR